MSISFLCLIWLIIGTVVAAIGCSHTYVNPIEKSDKFGNN